MLICNRIAFSFCSLLVFVIPIILHLKKTDSNRGEECVISPLRTKACPTATTILVHKWYCSKKKKKEKKLGWFALNQCVVANLGVNLPWGAQGRQGRILLFHTAEDLGMFLHQGRYLHS